MRSFFNDYLVPEKTQDQLIDELLEGELWDNNSPDAVPVSVEDWSTETETVTVERFGDGSIGVQSMEIPQYVPEGTISPYASLTGCSYSGGSGYSVASNCSISHKWGNVGIGFIASYQIINGAYDSITYLGPTTQTCAIGSCTRPEYVVSRLNETGSGPAIAQAQSTFTAYQGAASSEYWVQLSVGGNTVNVYNS